MSGFRLFSSGRGGARRKINRAPSPLLAHAVPWLSVMLASIVPTLLLIASAPVLPPLGFLFLVAWMQLRPGLLPLWVGLPLGLVDDLYSGQPLGSAVLLWSVTVIILYQIEARLPWRNFLMEGLVATALITVYIVFTLGLANIAGAHTPVQVVVPQVVVSVLVYPMVCRLVAALDRFRLLPFFAVG